MAALDLEDLAFLDANQKERYMALERLFESDGWHIVKAWADTCCGEALNRIVNSQSWDQNRVAVGARIAYLHMLNLESATEAEFTQYVEQAKEAKVDAEEAEDAQDNE
jgi:hypothetical protein